ncbi:hypothetical protein ACKFKF_28885 [Phormidesmis sp. 146-12]
MKRELRRIEETLNQLTVKVPGSTSVSAPNASAQSATKALSFEVQPRAATKPPATKPVRAAIAPAKLSAPEESATQTVTLDAEKVFVQPFTVEPSESKIPNLPRLKTPTFSSHKNGANPFLASNLLKELQTTVESWQTEHHQILRQIQDLYLEGPIVDGWLESHSQEPEVDPSVLRHAEVDRLLDYIEEICASPDQQVTCETLRTGYRLCGLNADGQLWSCPCPPEQVPSLSLAIARHQKLRQLLGRKQHLETRLNQLSETLVVMHSHLKE